MHSITLTSGLAKSLRCSSHRDLSEGSILPSPRPVRYQVTLLLLPFEYFLVQCVDD